jgi:hypothetical protein
MSNPTAIEKVILLLEAMSQQWQTIPINPNSKRNILNILKDLVNS